MMQMKAVAAMALALATSQAVAVDEASAANPIRRIVTLLQDMSTQVDAEGEKEKALYDKFMCFCEGNTANMGKEAEDAANRIQELTSRGKELVATKKRVGSELAEHIADRADAKATIGKATGIREKEAAEYAAEAGDSKVNIDALNRAIPAIEKGMSANSFVQMTNGPATLDVLKKLALVSRTVSSMQKENLQAFLSQGSESSSPYGAYSPASGEIVGILRQMKDEMDKDLGGIVEIEESAKKAFSELVGAKSAEIKAASEAIEAKTKRSGELAVAVVENKGDLRDTTASLGENQKFMATLSIQCETKTKEWEIRSKTRQQEIVAISQAIKVLNDDDALDLFKKTLPSGGKQAVQFLQTSQGASRTQRALAILQNAADVYKSPKLDLLSFMLTSHKVNFAKVLKMIDDMVAHLKREQTGDNQKKDYCNTELNTAADTKKGREQNIESLSLEISETEESVSKLVDEIASLREGVEALDKTVAEATEQRKKENAEFVSSQAELNAATQLIGKAKNRLQKFYNPKLYKAPPAQEMTEEEKIYANFGGEVAKDAVPTIAGTTQSLYLQLSSQTAPEAAPGTWNGGYKNKGAESGGVMALMDMLKKELETEMQEAVHDEETSQQEYEELMADSAAKRSDDSQALVDKEGAKADLSARVQEAQDTRSATNDELVAANEYLHNLHQDCDWLLENHSFREEARTTEISALANAKAVLNGASFSFLQRK